MSSKLHLWICDPDSPSELTTILSTLEDACPGTRGRTTVVYERADLSISDLAAGFGRYLPSPQLVVARAAECGRTTATAMIGAQADISDSDNSVAHLVYLGAFNCTNS